MLNVRRIGQCIVHSFNMMLWGGGFGAAGYFKVGTRTGGFMYEGIKLIS